MSDFSRICAFMFSLVASFSLFVTAIVWLSGGTFGQRCDRMFPNDLVRADLCVRNLANGDRP